MDIDKELVKTLLPVRARESHKGDFGRVLVLAGSVGFTGAARLCAMGAVRAGAGLVTVGTPRSCWPIVAAGAPEPMCHPLPEDESGRLSLEAWSWIEPALLRSDVCVIGPGLGRSDDIAQLVGLVLKAGLRVVLDADGINAYDGHILDCPCVLTPHEGEFVRAGGDLSAGRDAGARAFAAKTGGVLVLKGRHTLVASPKGLLRRNTTGNPGLAKGGSGDVLAGMIGALAGQGLTMFDAASAAVWLHGEAADHCARRWGEYAMTPSDLLLSLARVLTAYNGGKT